MQLYIHLSYYNNSHVDVYYHHSSFHWNSVRIPGYTSTWTSEVCWRMCADIHHYRLRTRRYLWSKTVKYIKYIHLRFQLNAYALSRHRGHIGLKTKYFACRPTSYWGAPEPLRLAKETKESFSFDQRIATAW